MSFTDTFATPDDTGEIRASELHTDLGSSLQAQAAEALDPESGISAMQLFRRARSAIAGGDLVPGLNAPDAPAIPEDLQLANDLKASVPDVSIDDARAQVKQAGLEQRLKLPDQPSMKAPVLDLMINEAQEHAAREAAIARGPQGFFPGALGFATQIGAGMIDPVNIAAFSVPVFGEARWGRMLANAGDSLFARAGVRAAQGAAQGAVGTAALQPADWFFHTADGKDYTFADSLRSIIMGAGMGAAAHAGLGGLADLRAKFGGRPLPGSTEELRARALGGDEDAADALQSRGEPLNVPAPVAGEETLARPGDEVPGLGGEPINASGGFPEGHPAAVLADLPAAAREDAYRATAAALIDGAPVRTAEMLNEAAKADPRIAESLEAFHGSPHDFDAFDIGKVGSGEGAQAYGHGLYFAENPQVAESYIPFSHGDAGDDIPAAQREGALYRVRINANKEHFLDWDKPLSEQNPHVLDRLAAIAERLKAGAGEALRKSKTPAGDWLETLSHSEGHAKFSADLRAAGIPGLKYLDQNSRPKGGFTVSSEFRPGGDRYHVYGPGNETRGTFSSRVDADRFADRLNGPAENATRNYVVFSDKDVEITHKNGEPVQRNTAPMPQAVPTDARIAADLYGQEPKPSKPPQSLLQFLRARGGLKPDPELSSIFGRTKLDLVRKDGMGLDEAREAAVEAGYLHDAGAGADRVSESTIAHLLEAMDAENRGNKVYPAGEHAPDEARAREVDRLEGEATASFGELGQKWRDVPKRTRDRALHIMYTEGVEDPVAAYERAVMEEDYYGEKAGQLQRVAGNQLPAESRAAPGAGRGDTPSGRPGEPGEAARRPGADDRGAPDWQSLANARPEYDDPQLVSESQQADAAPQPPSIDGGKAPSAAERALAEAEGKLEDTRAMMNEADRAKFDEVLQQLDRERDDYKQIITEGAACLAAAVA